MRKLQKKSLKLVVKGSEDLMEKKNLCDIKVQGEISRSNIEAIANYPENLTKKITYSGYTKQQI